MNLTVVSYYARRVIIISVLALVVVFLGNVYWNTIVEFYYTLLPPKTSVNPTFGNLPPLEFQPKINLAENTEFVLNTRNSALPVGLPKVIPVYRFLLPSFSYTAGGDAQKYALEFGYTDSELLTDLRGTIYRWGSFNFGSELVIDINSKEIELFTDLTSPNVRNLLSAGSLTEQAAITSADALLAKLNMGNDTLYKNAKKATVTGKVLFNTLVNSDSLRDAQFVRVDYNRSISTQNYPIFGPEPRKGLISIVVAGSSRDNLPPALKYPLVSINNSRIDENNIGFYPIINSRTAWEALLSGNAILAGIYPTNESDLVQTNQSTITRVLINEIYLAYYENDRPQTHLQPIYVFQGNYLGEGGNAGEVYYYVPAVQGSYVNSAQ